MEREDVLRSLRDMGFSDVHSEDLLTLQPGTRPQQLLGVVSELILLGVNPEPVYETLKKSPHLLKLPITQMKQRSSYLRRLGLGEGTGGGFMRSAEGPRWGTTASVCRAGEGSGGGRPSRGPCELVWR